MERKPRALVSACLMGLKCRYDGGAQRCPGIEALMDRLELIPVCPEQIGGLPTPRSPAERRGDRVFSRDGADVTGAFRRGADETCRLADLYGAKYALLKQRSPSCGCGRIYDGSFTGVVVPGFGMTAEKLIEMGLEVFSEEKLEAWIARFDAGKK